MSDVTDKRYEALREQHLRLRIAALAVIDEARAVGDREHPEAGIPAHVLRQLRRELDGTPQPNGAMWMSIT